jgi:hypothetical protein
MLKLSKKNVFDEAAFLKNDENSRFNGNLFIPADQIKSSGIIQVHLFLKRSTRLRNQGKILVRRHDRLTPPACAWASPGQ